MIINDPFKVRFCRIRRSDNSKAGQCRWGTPTPRISIHARIRAGHRNRIISRLEDLLATSLSDGSHCTLRICTPNIKQIPRAGLHHHLLEQVLRDLCCADRLPGVSAADHRPQSERFGGFACQSLDVKASPRYGQL